VCSFRQLYHSNSEKEEVLCEGSLWQVSSQQWQYYSHDLLDDEKGAVHGLERILLHQERPDESEYIEDTCSRRNDGQKAFIT